MSTRRTCGPGPLILVLALVGAAPAEAQLGVGGAIAEERQIFADAERFLADNSCISGSNQAAYARLLSDAEDIAVTLHNMWRSLLSDANGRYSYHRANELRYAGPEHPANALQASLFQIRDAIAELRHLRPCVPMPSYRYQNGRYLYEGGFAGGLLPERRQGESHGEGR